MYIKQLYILTPRKRNKNMKQQQKNEFILANKEQKKKSAFFAMKLS